MEIIHRISININDESVITKLIKMGVNPLVNPLPGYEYKIITISISESHKQWNEIVKLVREHIDYIPGSPGDIVDTVFTDEDIRNAEWVRLVSGFEQGYPEPKGTWPIKQKSYKLICDNCCIYNQSDVMRLKKEPHLGKKSFMTAIWTNELFCVPEVFTRFEEIGAKGYEIWDVAMHKTGEPLQKIKQLYVNTIANSGFIPEKTLDRKICQKCGEVKYYPHAIGKMKLKRKAISPNTDFILTNEWFGHGYLSWRELLVSNRIACLILDNRWSGVRMKVVDIV